MNKKILLGTIILIIIVNIVGAIPETLQLPEVTQKTINVSTGKPDCKALIIIISPPDKPTMLCYHTTSPMLS